MNVGFEGICVGLIVGDLVVGLMVVGLHVGAVGFPVGDLVGAWGIKDGVSVGGLEGSLDG